MKLEAPDEDSGLLFTATTEFCRGLEREESRKPRTRVENEGEDEEQADQGVGAFKAIKQEEDMSDDDDDGDDDENGSVLNDEGVANQGLAATLALIKNRGDSRL